MSDITTKTYPPEFLQRLSDDHEAEQAAATTEESSAVQAKGDAMSDITRFDIRCLAVTKRENGEWVRYEDHLAVVERLKAERDLMATHPRGREVGRYGFDGHYHDAMEPERPTDEDIWREAFMRQLHDPFAKNWTDTADLALAEYRKRWPR